MAVATGQVGLQELAGLVEQAADRISARIIRTPAVRLPWLDSSSREVWAKLECWQLTGAFKARGAYNALLQAPARTRVVTASAGNHGLAVASAASELGLSATICVPVNASELKTRRLLDAGAAVVPVGQDLHAAEAYAMAESDRTGARYVSAYADLDVTAGQGTWILEAEQQAGAFDTVIVPLGGGGLLTGTGGYLAARSRSTRLIAAHPMAFNRDLAHGDLASQLTRPVVPTIADGLAAQLDDGNPYISLMEAATDAFVAVPERLIEASVYALLHCQGLLVEGAGAVGVAALLQEGEDSIGGRVLVVLSGGNISSTQLAHIMSTAVDEPHLRRLLGLRAVRSSLESTRAVPAGSAPAAMTRDAPPVADAARVWTALIRQAAADLDDLRMDWLRHSAYIEELDLRRDDVVATAMERQFAAAGQLLSQCQGVAAGWPLRARYRLLVQLLALLRCGLQWCSASYDQSLEVMFFDPSEQRHSGVNYARYGSPALRSFELERLRAMGFDPGRVELLATSSGMAAYQLIESFLLRHVLEPGDRIAHAPYVYFEAAEELRGLKFLEHADIPSYDVAGIIRAVEGHDAKVVFLDPLANVAGLPAVDLRELGRQLQDRQWSHRWLVIDGTMVSGGLNPSAWFEGGSQPQVLYYESGSKYLQLGLDLEMTGVCVFDWRLLGPFLRIRRNSGTTMYPRDIAQFPRYGRQDFLARMRVLTRNAECLAAALARIACPEEVTVGFPTGWTAYGWEHAGGVVSLTFGRAGLNNRDVLEALIQALLEDCRAASVPMTKGVSFGFSTTRVSASSAMAETSDPFLRFSVGEESDREMERLCKVTTWSISRFLARRLPSS